MMETVNDWETRAFERSCAHCSRESQGKVYSGREYLRVLQELKGGDAERLAHKVEPFFWSDADMIHVHLCDDCTARLCITRVPATHALQSSSAA